MKPINGLFHSLVNYCNSHISNTSEYNIARAVFEITAAEGDLSLESLAGQANISQASVSRFVRKASFVSYQEFRECCALQPELLGARRRVAHAQGFQGQGAGEIAGRLFERTMRNLQSTYSQLDLGALLDIVGRIKRAQSVSFFGDEHALSIFYPLQLDILASRRPAYLFKNEAVQEEHAGRLRQGDLAFFLNVSKNFIAPREKTLIRQMKGNGVYLALFSQEEPEELEGCFDLSYRYGLPGTHNDGFPSLCYLHQLLCELFYYDGE